MRVWRSLGLWWSVIALLLPLQMTSRTSADEIAADTLDLVPLENFNEKEDFKLTVEERSVLEILGSLVGLSLSEIEGYLSLVKVGLGVAETLEKLFLKVFNGTSLDFSFLDRPGVDKQLLSMYEIITLRLEQIKISVEGTEGSLHSLVKGLPYMVRWEIALNTLEDYMKPINNLHHRFTYYQRHKMDVEDHTMLDFAENVVSHSTTSIQALMANIHSIAAPSDPPILRGARTFDRDEYDIYNRVTRQMSVNMRRLLTTNPEVKKFSAGDTSRLQSLTLRPSIFRMLEEAIENYDNCHYEQSPQQLVFGLYTLLALTLARAYTMVNFSYSLLKIHHKGNFTIESQLSDELYRHYSEGILKNGVNVMNRVSTAYRRCDPTQHIEGKTFEMVTELLQGYIENEVDLNPRGTCSNNCAVYQHTNVNSCYFPETQYCGKHRRCKGMVHDCKFFEADAYVCISDKPYRRYDWIEYESKKKLGVGTKHTCPNMMKIDSWWRFLYHCSYCVCLCDDPTSPTSDRFISLRTVVSDIAKGMIVTGIRFTKDNRVIHIQVQQGKAMPQGQVDPHTVHWVDVEPMSVGTKKFVENKDYVVLNYLTRNVDLDQLTAPKGHAITGVKFRMLGTHVNLEVWATPINFTTGIMTPSMSFWLSNDNTPVMSTKPRKELKLFDPDDPRKSYSQSEVDSHSDMFITLQPTSMRTDVSQLTVPFLDAQPVAPVPPSWLHGIQLYHRGRRGYGGFIGFRVFNYNVTRHFQDEMDKEKHDL